MGAPTKRLEVSAPFAVELERLKDELSVALGAQLSIAETTDAILTAQKFPRLEVTITKRGGRGGRKAEIEGLSFSFFK